MFTVVSREAPGWRAAMSGQQKIKASEVVADIRACMTNQELMTKYGLSRAGLKDLFGKLVAARAISEGELDERVTEEPVPDSPIQMRREDRHYLVVALPVYDLNDLTVEGHVIDINRLGLKASGIGAEVGEEKTLLIQADEFADVYPFTFDVACRWVRSDEEDGEITSGYEITGISRVGLRELLKLVDLLALGK